MTVLTSGMWGVDWPPIPLRGHTFTSSSVMDAANEAVHMTGHVVIPDGGSKTISAAGGGKILWTASSSTFANAGTTLRIGIQDPDTSTSPIRGDGTFDVYADLVGGTDTIATYTPYQTAMESGTKTISDKQLITIAFTMTARGGTDAVTPYSATLIPKNSATKNALLPTVSANTGTWATINAGAIAAIVFDDASVGWIELFPYVSDDGGETFNSGSTYDEYGNLFTPQVETKIFALWAMIATAGTSSDYELCLYSDPLGTPSLIEAISIDATATHVSTAARPILWRLSTKRTLSAGTLYAVTVRPTTANNVTLYDHELVLPKLQDGFSPGYGTYAIRRVDNSGAFSAFYTSTSGDKQMYCGMRVEGWGTT